MVAVDTRLFTLLSARQGFLGERQAVLARNIANADSPGFLPLDLSEDEFRRKMSRPGAAAAPVALAATASGHLPPTRAAAGPTDQRPRTEKGWEISPAGNGVVLEEQAEVMARVQMNHKLGSDLYRKYVAMWRTALGHSG